jgi:sialidase-1
MFDRRVPRFELPSLLIGLLMNCLAVPHAAAIAADAPPAGRTPVELEPLVRSRCLDILRDGLQSREFWHAMHAAEGLTAAGQGAELRPVLTDKLATETDDQRRCGLARELGDGAAVRQAYAANESPGLTVMAGAALARGGNPLALITLRELLQSEDQLTGKLAAWALARVGDRSDIPGLKKRMATAEDPADRAFYEFALAVHGDPEGRAALIRNLASEDDGVRSMASEFAPDVPNAAELVPALVTRLNDKWPDARIRAAHALMAIANPPAIDRGEDITSLPFEATPEFPRHTEGSLIDLDDGSLLCAMTSFSANTSDFAKAQIVGRTSTDGGRTWGEPRVLQENTGGLNVMSVTLRRLKAPAEPGTIAMFFLQKNAYDDLRLYVRFSNDEAQTFGEPVLVTPDSGYHVVNNDRVTQLSTGRLVVPAASTADVEKENHFVCHCYVSDDGGQTWRATPGKVDVAKRGAMEPEVIELKDGRLMMIIRTQLGQIATSLSEDGGETWSAAGKLDVVAPEAPATIRRIPATGDLLLIWNNVHDAGAGHGGARTPLNTAISTDDGQTWRNVKVLEPDLQRTYSYISVLFVRNRLLLTYWDNPRNADTYSARFRSLPVSWLYSD